MTRRLKPKKTEEVVMSFKRALAVRPLRQRRRRWVWLAILSSVVLLVAPAIAYASTVEDFAQGIPDFGAGYNINGQTFLPEGYISRDLVRVYHAGSGTTWTVYYCTTTQCFDYVTNSTNPTSQGANVTNAQAFCASSDDLVSTLFTCQTTKP